MPEIENSKIYDLHEKYIIAKLYMDGVTRDQIKSILGIGSEKVGKVIKHLKPVKGDSKNE